MLPLSDFHSYSKPKIPEFIDRKSSFFTTINRYISFHHRRIWFFLAVLLLQLLLILSGPSLPFSLSAANSPTSRPKFRNFTYRNSITKETTASIRKVFNEPTIDRKCPYGKVYVYDLPPLFNSEIVKNCDGINPWSSRCDTLSNLGFGKSATPEISKTVPENVTGAWFWSDQFSLEVIYHHRMMNYRCRTLEPESAAVFYIPSYSGLALEKFLFADHSTAEERDRHCNLMLDWISDQDFFKKSDGWNHFTTMGRISWDFRRSKDEDWGSSCIYKPKMRNITRLLIEKNPWDYFDVGVPYPTGFHPMSVSDVTIWQEFVRSRKRHTLYCFAGATRGFINNDFRGILLNQCYSEPGSCRVVDCGGSKCENGSSVSVILETFLDSDFCLQPRGDSFTRRSVFDCMVAGSIPVFFWHRTAYLQYEWYLPHEPGSYSVFIDRNAVKNGTSVKDVLKKISKEEVKKMREKVIEYLPRLIYANSDNGLEGMRDAFDVAVEGVLKRTKEREGGYKWK